MTTVFLRRSATNTSGSIHGELRPGPAPVFRHDTSRAPQLEEIQSRLFDAGSAIATPSTSSSESKMARTRFDADAGPRRALSPFSASVGLAAC